MSDITPEEFQSWLETCTRVRYAEVSKSLARNDQIERYLPGNYQIIYSSADIAIVAGADVAGWTLDDYVIPRLSSGLITSRELPTVKAEVYHNLSRDAFFGLNTVFRPNVGPKNAKQQAKTDDEYHPLVKVYEYRTYLDDPQHLCERAFAAFNGGSGREEPRYFARGLRSLSVGDVVIIGGEFGKVYPLMYSCESMGFKERFNGELRIVTDVSPYGERASLSVPWTEDEPNE